MNTCVRKTIVLTIIIRLYTLSSAYGNLQSETAVLELPWAVIAEKAIAGHQFCIHSDPNNDVDPNKKSNTSPNLDSESNYAFKIKQSLSIGLTGNMDVANIPQIIDINVEKYIRNSWQDKGKVIANLEQARIRISDGIDEEGFFKLSFDVKQKNGELSSVQQVYAIISNDWKKDLFGFCQKLKYELESSRDPQLYRSCIVTSHIDQTMEIVSRTSFLSNKILCMLLGMIRAKNAYDSNGVPDFVTGVNKIRLRRFEGSPSTEFTVFVPEGYDGSQKWSIRLCPNPMRENQNYAHSLPGCINILWHFPRYMHFEWKDFEFFLNILRKKYSLDEDRYYIYAWCGNSMPAMALALMHPDQWAYANLDSGNSYINLAGNALNLNLNYTNFIHQHDNIARAYCNFVSRCFQYFGCRKFTQDHTENPMRVQPKLPAQYNTKEKSPTRVLYTMESLHNPKAYWVAIQGRQDENFPGTIDAQVHEQSIVVKTKNINAYSLDLMQAPIDGNKPIEIIENGKSLSCVKGETFVKKSEMFENAKFIKNKHICGPVADAFTEPYVVVCGTGTQDANFVGISKKIANSLASGAPCFTDSNIPANFVNTHNLIIVGTLISDLWLSEICAKLPVQIKNDQLIANGKSYQNHNMGFILIYPNPLNPEKYIALFSATSSMAMGGILEAYLQMNATQPADVGVYEVTENGVFKWHVLEVFNTVWDWHSEWNTVFTKTNKHRTELPFCQWITQVVRQQLEADIAICNNPFSFFYLVSDNEITYRDLFTSLENDWIVKISLNGKDLRRLLISLPNRVSKEKADTLIVDGIGFGNLESNSEQDILTMAKLKDNTQYTIAISSKIIRNAKMQFPIEDYKITGDGYLILLLKEYLLHDTSFDIDAQLDNLKLNVS